MKKILLGLIILPVLFLTGCNFLPVEEVTTHEVDVENYYNVSTVEELLAVETYQSYQLMNDIDLGGTEWTPIGSLSNPYQGNFNGNGYTISNFTITENHLGYVGLFGYVEGDIENLNVTDFTINISDSFMISVGGLAGLTFGNVSDVVVDGTIEVESTNGNVYAGLLVGQALTDLQTVFVDDVFSPNELINNTVSGSLTVTSTQIVYAGGLLGKAQNIKILNNLVNPVSIELINGSTVFTGGLVGHQFLYDFDVVDPSLVIDKTLISENIVNTSFVLSGGLQVSLGGLIGYNQNSLAENNFVKNTYDLEVSHYYFGLLVGENWLGSFDSNVTMIEAYSSTEATEYLGSIVGLQQTTIGSQSGFVLNLTSLSFSDVFASEITLSDIQGDTFYQSNFSDLDTEFISQVQGLLPS